MSDITRNRSRNSGPSTQAGSIPSATVLSRHGHSGPELAAGVTDIAVLLGQLFDRVDSCIALRLWNGSTIRLGRPSRSQRAADCTLVCHSPRTAISLLVRSDPLRFVEAYFRGELDIEGDFFSAVNLKEHLGDMRIRPRDKLRVMGAAWRIFNGRSGAHLRKDIPGVHVLKRAREVRSHSRHENQRAISFHYDVSNDFYALWLDETMVYSCAYFHTPQDSLTKAQRSKLDLICRKLLLKPGDRFLDIGCGWGALLLHAARHYGVRAHGITLSQKQLDYARKRIIEEGLQGRVAVALADYRDLDGSASFDKIASVGMFEHVGLKNLPAYFSKVHRLLKPGGLFLNHGITHDVEGWERTMSTEFINRYIFPDGQLDTISNIQRVMERTGFEIADIESLRSHYALTLRHWVNRLERHHTQALRYVSESTWRTWRLYMAACALEFETGEIGVYQILASKRARQPVRLPLTRRHLLIPELPILQPDDAPFVP